MNPNFGELLADLRLLWERWREVADKDQEASDMSRAITRRMCMEDIERLIEKYSDDPKLRIAPCGDS